MAAVTTPIRVVAYHKDGIWVVQGIEYDITTRAIKAKDVPAAFAAALAENEAIDRHLGRKPLAGIKAAPARFIKMFARGSPVPPDEGDVRDVSGVRGVEVRLVDA